jgi:universal stress protein A
MSAFQNVIVGIDLNEETAGRLLERACQLAEPTHIEVIHACDHLHHQHQDYVHCAFESSEELDAAVIREADQFLNSVCEPMGIQQRKVLDGRTATVLHDYATNHADLVVIGSHGRHGLEAFFGSTSNEVVHGTPCDVLAVHLPPDDAGEMEAGGRYTCVLAAVDLSVEASQVMDHARRVADACGAELKLCHVSKHLQESGRKDDWKRLLEFAAGYGLPATDIHELAGRTAHAIHNLAEELDADLVVVGTHGKHGANLITGSTANAVLHGANCDELSVRIRPAA